MRDLSLSIEIVEMISSQARYIRKIHKIVRNTKINRSHNQKQSNKPLVQSHSMNIHSQNNDMFRKESLHSKCEHQKHNIIVE